MTRIEHSPEQNIAEAAGRRPLEEQSLTLWQAAYFAEPPIRLTSRHPQAIRQDREEGGESVIEATAVGADLSSALVNYLDGSRGHYPVHDALLLFDRYCRRAHRSWPDHRGRPVCAELAWLVLRDRTSLAFAAEQTALSWPRAERLLLMAVGWMRRRQEGWLSDERMSASHDREYCAVCRTEAV